MNEILHKGLKLQLPKVVKVELTTDQAYQLSLMLKQYAKDHAHRQDKELALHLAHKFWIPWYQLKCWAGAADRETFVCLTRTWTTFCTKFIKHQLQGDPLNPDLNKLLVCVSNGKEV